LVKAGLFLGYDTIVVNQDEHTNSNAYRVRKFVSFLKPQLHMG
jgi:hypothetical protein